LKGKLFKLKIKNSKLKSAGNRTFFHHLAKRHHLAISNKLLQKNGVPPLFPENQTTIWFLIREWAWRC